MKQTLFKLILAAMIFGVIEGISFVAIRVLHARNYLSDPPQRHGHTIDYARRMRIQRPILGWPLLEGRDVFGGELRDRSGARRLPAFPDPDRDPSCVAMYGDSFVQAVEIDAEHTWANVLAHKLGCRVANYGQAAYGTDQALLRHRLNDQDRAPVVILGHMHEDMRRVLTRIRDFLVGARDHDLKPRLVLDRDGNLAYVPIPVLTEAEYERVVGLRSPFLKLAHENFQPGGPLVAAPARFPYTLSLIRAFGDYRVRARLHGNRPTYAEFYEPGNQTRGLELMTAIAESFHDEAQRRGQIGIVLFLPPREVLRYYMQTGTWIHQALLDRLAQLRIPTMDFGPYLLEHTGDVMNEPFAPDGHYGARGDALLADMIDGELRRLQIKPGVLPSARPGSVSDMIPSIP